MAKVISAAVRVFTMSNGYHRTQMADIAAEAGVSKAALYLYVENKETLLDLAVRYADTAPPDFPSDSLPVAAPKPDATLDYIVRRMSEDTTQQDIMKITSREATADPVAEVGEVVHVLFQALSANRNAIKLIDRCSADRPDLAQVWFNSSRVGILQLLEPYITKRIEQGAFLPVADTTTAARILLETCATWAVHIHWDPYPQDLPEEKIESSITEFLQRMLTGGETCKGSHNA